MQLTDIRTKRVVHPELDAIALGITDVVLIAINRQTAAVQSAVENKQRYVLATLIEILENAV